MSSYKTKGEATSAGKKVLDVVRREFPRAKLHVNENLGWYWGINVGNIHLHSFTHNDGTTKYHCLMSCRGDGGGEMYWTGETWYSSPIKAIESQLKLAREHISQCERALETVQRCRKKGR